MPHLHRQPRRRPALAAKRALARPSPRHRRRAPACAAEVERGKCEGQGGEGGEEEEGGEESGGEGYVCVVMLGLGLLLLVG